MAVIGGFRSDLSITLKTDGNFGNVSAGFSFPKSRINENGGKERSNCGKSRFERENSRILPTLLVFR